MKAPSTHAHEKFGGSRGALLSGLLGSLVALGCGTASPTTGTEAGGAGGVGATGGSLPGGSAGHVMATGGAANGGAATGGSTSAGGATAHGGASAVGGTGGSSAAGGSTGGAGMPGGAGVGGAPASGGNGAGGSLATGGAAGAGAGSAGAGMGGTSTGGVGVGGAAGTGGSAVGGSGGMPLVYDTENTGADCTVATTFPAFTALTKVANLPDPFLLESGTRISTSNEWRCRRAEISNQIQYWGSGPKGAPPATETATFSGGKLTVVVTQGSTSITLSSTITTPSGAGPFPIVISMDGSGVPTSIFTSSGVASMTFTSSQLVPNSSSVTRGAGDYFKIYPDTNTGAMIEWAWGVSRLIDGLQKTAADNKIDTKHIAVKGCSYAGKMALYAGAFDERVALTIPEESGGGGEASWRFMATQTGTEDLEVAQGTAWYAKNLLDFKNPDAPKLTYDQHELVAMVAPRAILAIENTGIDRLGSQAGSVSMKAATEVYKALGIPDRIGFSQAQASSHCSFPSSQTADVQAFVDKFLLGKTSANTAIAKSSYNTDMTPWITWSTPQLQ